jgi:hypothetical protein
MSGLWSMFWFKSFRKFCRKIAIFCTFDHWSEILSLSAGRPISQGVCPALVGSFLMIFFAPYKVNIPLYAGEFFLCYFFVPYKVNIPMYAGGFKQVQYKEYICWMQVKIYISDQTSLRICNSVRLRGSVSLEVWS